MNNLCLIVIDVQERLFPVMHQKEELLKNLEILIKGFKLFELPIFITEQVPEKLGPTIAPIVSLLDGIEPTSKTSFSCAADSKFMSASDSLNNNDGIVLAGIETHVCVYQTEKDLINRGHHVEVVTDAVSSRVPNNHRVALDRIRNNGGFLTTTEMLLFNIQADASGKDFKKLAKLVK